MRRKAVCVFVILLFLGLVSGGCGDKGISTDVLREGTAVSTQEPEEDGEKHWSDTIDENTGVVIDTVVDVFSEPDVLAERITQAIFNQPVKILEEGDSWTKIMVVDGSTGWAKTKYISKDRSSITKSNFKYKVIITSKTKKVFSQISGGITLKETVMGTEFYSNEKVDGVYKIALPGSISGWINESGTMELGLNRQIPKTSAEDFSATAQKLKGASYLKGGISVMGTDSSGLIYICGRINGINFPRIENGQYRAGRAVSVEEIKAGDIVFFSMNEDMKDISYAGIFIGDGQFIHANKTKGYVTISRLDDSEYQKRFINVMRLFE